MIICKICNSTVNGNGYCGQHSTSGIAYIIEKSMSHFTQAKEEGIKELDIQFPHEIYQLRQKELHDSFNDRAYKELAIKDVRSFLLSFADKIKVAVIKDLESQPCNPISAKKTLKILEKAIKDGTFNYLDNKK